MGLVSIVRAARSQACNQLRNKPFPSGDGAGTDSTPYGNGTLCVGGPLFRFSPGLIGAGGIAGQPVDYTTLPAAGAITVGSTWRFQFHYRDHAGGGAFFNLTEGLEILFGV